MESIYLYCIHVNIYRNVFSTHAYVYIIYIYMYITAALKLLRVATHAFRVRIGGPNEPAIKASKVQD